jgi:hypothetical protein
MIKIEIVNAEIWSFRQFPGSKRQIFFEIKTQPPSSPDALPVG